MKYLPDVTTLELFKDRCTGCGMCTEVCPHAVMVMDSGRASIGDRDACMECGACAKNCPADAIHVQIGVGCAQAVINNLLGRKSSCCSLDDYREGFSGCGSSETQDETQPARRSGCC
jgi:NAD-dependent dihydropyrimidine dehydrogenase PreA subunit